LRTIAESPAVLEGYISLSKAFDRSSLNANEQHIVQLSTSFENEIPYCVAGHTTFARMQEVPDDVVQAVRQGEPIPDAKLEALREFTSKVVKQRGRVTQNDVQGFLKAGYTRAQVLEVILGVGLKIISNYTNQIAETPLDAAFESGAWSTAQTLQGNPPAKEMTNDELKQRLEAGESITIVDIREADEFADWHIHDSINIPLYNAIKSGDMSAIERGFESISPDKPVVTVCRAGNTSKIVADRLASLGYNAFSLTGGIRGWNTVWSEAPIPTGDTWRLIQIRRNGKGCLSYMFWSDGEAAVVDPSVDAAVYSMLASREGVRITHVFETHVHADHISRARQLSAETGAALHIPKNGRVQYEYRTLQDGDTLSLGAITITVLATPGHTRESVSLDLNGKVLLSGDTVFTDNIGRPDLENGDAGAEDGARMLYESLHDKVLTLDDEIVVGPGHTSGTLGFDGVALTATLGDIRKRIEAVVAPAKDKFVRTIIVGLGEKPPNFERVLSLNEGRAELDGLDPIELEAGPNRCAV
jgi:glyoxylase-like metal-dependent hydrolase (beta-lactamase superfamily II)/alkylhydroperoxidase family enzyme